MISLYSVTETTISVKNTSNDKISKYYYRVNKSGEMVVTDSIMCVIYVNTSGLDVRSFVEFMNNSIKIKAA